MKEGKNKKDKDGEKKRQKWTESSKDSRKRGVQEGGRGRSEVRMSLSAGNGQGKMRAEKAEGSSLCDKKMTLQCHVPVPLYTWTTGEHVEGEDGNLNSWVASPGVGSPGPGTSHEPGGETGTVGDLRPHASPSQKLLLAVQLPPSQLNCCWCLIKATNIPQSNCGLSSVSLGQQMGPQGQVNSQG